MIVGSYHMANPGRDFANVNADDVLAAKRQAEIVRLVGLLAAFKPTAIGLEYTADRDSTMNARYRAHRAGSGTLARSESEQVGFRLAASQGHARVYGIDYHENLDINGVMSFAMANGFQSFAQLMGDVQRRVAETSVQFAKMSIPEIFVEQNSPAMDAVLSFYLRAAKVGKDTNYVGATMASAWYDRNLKIFSNISRLAAGPNDRVLVLIGAGHAPILRSFIRDAGEWELVNPVPYLAK